MVSVTGRDDARERLKAVLPESARGWVRRLGRLRWATKARVVRRHGCAPWRHLPYILFDPEVDSFSYSLENEDELADLLGQVLEQPSSEIARYVREVSEDPLYRQGLRPPLRRRPWLKRRIRPSWQLAPAVAIRVLKPRCVVETGVLDGYASTVMLCALELNRREGHAGELVSIDVLPTSGSLVPSALTGGWQRVIEDARTALPRVLEGRCVDLFVSDSVQAPEHVAAELTHVLAHRADDFVFMTPYGSFMDLERLTGIGMHRLQERPRNHHFPGNVLAIGRGTREGRDRPAAPLGVHAPAPPRSPAQLHGRR
jgi:hypothetical protein